MEDTLLQKKGPNWGYVKILPWIRISFHERDRVVRIQAKTHDYRYRFLPNSASVSTLQIQWNQRKEVVQIRGMFVFVTIAYRGSCQYFDKKGLFQTCHLAVSVVLVASSVFGNLPLSKLPLSS